MTNEMIQEQGVGGLLLLLVNPKKGKRAISEAARLIYVLQQRNWKVKRNGFVFVCVL